MAPLREFYDAMQKSYGNVEVQTELSAKELCEQEDKLENLLSESKQTQKDIKVLLQSYDNFKEENGKKQKQLAEERDEAKAKVRELEEQSNQDGYQIEELQSTVDALNSEKNDLDERCRELEAKVADLQDKLANAPRLDRSTMDLQAYNSMMGRTQPPSPSPMMNATGQHSRYEVTDTPITQQTNQPMQKSYRIGQFARGRNLMDTSYASSGQGLSVHGRNVGQLNLNSQEAIVIQSNATSQENLIGGPVLGGRGTMTQSTLQ